MPELTEDMKYSTLLESVRNSLFRAGRYNRSDMVAPAAILWTDADSQWEPLVGQLRPLMPELLTLGEYHAEEKTGPAIWLRCVIERSLPDIELPEDAIPIIYMPNISRQTLRAVEECPDSLKPLVELQYRGTVWTQRNGRDWTVEAFLISEDGGLGLDVARDRNTRRSMIGALAQLTVTPIMKHRGQVLNLDRLSFLSIFSIFFLSLLFLLILSVTLLQACETADSLIPKLAPIALSFSPVCCLQRYIFRTRASVGSFPNSESTA